jgi:N-acetyl-beta-hexosaminidase
MMESMTTIANPPLNCLPWPRSLSIQGESLPRSLAATQTALEFVGFESPPVVAYAEQILGRYRLGNIVLEVEGAEERAAPQLMMDESYRLEVTATEIRLQAAEKWGALRGLSTLAQLARHDQVLPGLTIQDSPRFPWRGLLLDVARHFFPLTSLLAVVDGLAMLKMNVLHLHLSDDQGFRFPSSGYPNLASAQHYTVDELKTLVAYASDRGVRVVPELDMPGHVTSWLVAHPEWGAEACDPSQGFGVHKGCLNPLNESVYDALATLLTELADVFPDAYVHVGGDEVSPDWWLRDPQITDYLHQRQMTTQDLQNEFLTRVCSLVRDLGKTPVAWDEVLHPHMPDCLVQNWRGATTRDRGLALSKPVLVSAPYYLDLHYPAGVHYGFDPEAPQADWLALEDALQDDPRLRHVAKGIEWTKQWRQEAVEFAGAVQVLGGEACLWSELVTPQVLPTRLWSRLPAVAERLWSAADVIDEENMYQRLQASWLTLPEDPELLAQTHLRAMGYDLAQIEVICLMEPVKWYGRLLGEQALRARLTGSEMPSARPYRLDTPLDRTVDWLLPESLSARRLCELELGESSAKAEYLTAQSGVNQLPDDLPRAVEALRLGALALQEYLGGDQSLQQTIARLEALDVPYGEFMVAPLAHWRWSLATDKDHNDGG